MAPPQASQRLDLGKFQKAWNEKAKKVPGPQIQGEINVKDGTFLHQFTDTLGLLGEVDTVTGAMKKVTVLVVRTGDRLANVLGLRAWDTLLYTVDPTMTDAKRDQVFSQVGIKGGKLGAGTFTDNGITYAFEVEKGSGNMSLEVRWNVP